MADHHPAAAAAGIVADRQPSNGTVGSFRSSTKRGVTMAPQKPPRSTGGSRASGWPMACSLLLLVQFFERLSFVNVKALLVPHLATNLGMDSALAAAILPPLIQCTFTAAIVGAILADAKYGKYGTLLWLFPAYFLGQLLITFSPILPAPSFIHPYFDFFALFLLAYGCGCVRGVLPSYGGDQIWPLNVPQLGSFSALFYAQEHLATIWCSLLQPFLGAQLASFPLPLPTAIANKPVFLGLFMALFILWISLAILFGTSRYFRQDMPKGAQSVFGRAWQTICHAIHNKRRFRQRRLVTAKAQTGPAPKNLLDHFLDDHNCERDKECDFGRRQQCAQAKFLVELKCALRMCLVLSPLALFWAFQSQLSSILAIQAQSVDARLPFIGLPLLPFDQLAILPNLLALLFIAFFYLFLFRSASISQCLSLNTYLRRISIGIFLAAVACAFSASVQMLLNMSPSPPIQSPPNAALFKLHNVFPSDCTVSLARVVAGNAGPEFLRVDANAGSQPNCLQASEVAAGFADFQFRFRGASCAGHSKSRTRVWIKPGKLNLAIVGPQGILWTALNPRPAGSGGGQSSIGALVLLPCNSLDAPLPLECANSTGDSLVQALTPFSSGLSLCPSDASAAAPLDNSMPPADNSTSNGTSDAASSNGTSVDLPASSFSSSSSVPSCLTWTPEEAILSQLFVFPPRGDNLGMARATLYEPKSVQAGSYKLTLVQSTMSADDSSSISSVNDTSAAADSALPSPPPDSASSDSSSSSADSSNGTGNGGGLKEFINLSNSSDGTISMLLLSLDGSPLAGQNDSSSRPNPTLILLQLAGPPSVSILWLFPQSLLMAASEVLIGVTGLEFCYHQAPNALKATMIGFWYLMVSLGISYSGLLAKLQPFSDLIYQQLFLSASLFSVGLLFVSLAHFFYKYRDNLTGSYETGGGTGQSASGLAEKLEGTLRASMAKLPTKKVIRL